MADPMGKLYFAKGKGGVLELVVPAGTQLGSLVRLNEILDHRILPHISPRGCSPCLSGIPFVIREDLEQVARVDLKSGAIEHELVK
jgi:hypothetical protein